MTIQPYQLEPEYTLPVKKLKKKSWKKKFRNVNLRALQVADWILLGVFVKDIQSCQVKLNVVLHLGDF